MIDLILILLIVALALLSAWLYFAIEYIEQELYIKTSLVPKLNIEATFIRIPNKREIYLEVIKDRFLSILPHVEALVSIVILLGSGLIVGLGTYFFIKWTIESKLYWVLGPASGLILGFLLWILKLLRAGGFSKFFYGGSGWDGRLPLERMRVVNYHGGGKLPKRVYEGDSKNITIELYPTFRVSESYEEPIHIQKTKSGLSITLKVLTKGGVDEYLEFELLAAGFEIDGDKKQRQSLALHNLRYQWNCYFPKSGSHDYAFVIRILSPMGYIEAGCIENSTKVVKIDHMTQRQVWVFAAFAGIVSGSLALAEALHRLGVW